MSDTDELLNKPGSGPGWDSARVRLALVAIVTLGVAAHFYHITAPLFDWHYYRQHDTAAFARNFYEDEAVGAAPPLVKKPKRRHLLAAVLQKLQPN